MTVDDVAGVDGPGWDPRFEAALRPGLRMLAPADAMPPDLDLTSAGLDSFGTVEVLVRLEDEYGPEVGAALADLDPFEVFATPLSLWCAVRQARAVAEGAGHRPWELR